MKRSDFQDVGEADCDMETTWILKQGVSHEDACLVCEAYNLHVDMEDIRDVDVHKVICVRGKSKDFGVAFQCHIMELKCIIPDHVMAPPVGDVMIHAPDVEPCPCADVDVVLECILGLDNIPYMEPYIIPQDNLPAPLGPNARRRKSYRRNPQLYTQALPNLSTPYLTPLQVATLYQFPTVSSVPLGTALSGQIISIISLGGGYRLSDVQTYFRLLGITTAPRIRAFGVNGATNSPDSSAASVENALDIEIAAALAPLAETRVYIAPNTFQSFYNAIYAAINAGSTVISISWGAPEARWPTSTANAFNVLFKYASDKLIPVTAATGDRGSSDGLPGLNVNYPASSPHVLACGGTRLKGSTNGTIASEVVWNNNSTTSATGGGVSKIFAAPTYQTRPGAMGTFPPQSKRAIPDVCGSADPTNGYLIYMNGTSRVVGGTSAVSPMWAGLIARLSAIKGRKMGPMHNLLYTTPSLCRDVTVGNNGFYSASRGWDACTGIGSPIGKNF